MARSISSPGFAIYGSSSSSGGRRSQEAVNELRSAAGLSPSHGKAVDLLTFDEQNEYLRRGVGLYKVMANMGFLLKEAKGSHETHALSRKVPHLEAFLSHNWVIWRGYKFLALAMHYNMAGALACVTLFLCVHLVLAAFGLLPVFHHQRLGFDMTFLPNTMSPMLFFVLLLLLRELPGRCGQRGPAVFLDKVCINQTDANEQVAGIRKLGAFLTASETMIVLYSEIYLNKLWTVYEIACFLSVRGADDVVFLSMHQAKSFFLGLAATCVGGVSYSLASVLAPNPALIIVTPLIAVIMYTVAARKWAKDQAHMAQSLNTFTIRACTCQEDSDRPLVYRSIDLFMKFQGAVPMDAAVDDALDAFDLKVRQELPHALRTLMGGSGWSYKQILVICFFCSAGPQLFEHFDVSWQGQIAVRLNLCIFTFFVFPMAVLSIDRLMHAFLHMRGVKEALWILFVGTSVAVISGSLPLVGSKLTVLATESLTVLIGQAAIAIIGPLVPWRWARSYVIVAKKRVSKQVAGALASPDRGSGSEAVSSGCSASHDISEGQEALRGMGSPTGRDASERDKAAVGESSMMDFSVNDDIINVVC